MSKTNTQKTSFANLPLVLNVCDIATIMNISLVSAYELVHTKDFPVIRVGRRIKIPRNAFEHWLDETALK